MTHKPNPKHLPPRKSADEYERELAALSPKGDHVETGESDYMPWPQERGDTVSSFPDPEPTEGDDE
jgi:hypothetical protein